MPLDPTYPLVPVLNFLGAFLVLIPLPWQLQSWNSGICIIMIWTCIGCLVRGTNAVIWKDNVEDWAPWWCDISSHLIVGGPVVYAASSFSIVRRLYKISRMNGVPTTREEKRRELLIDLSLCLGLPFLVMVLYTVVQARRYGILEQIGCTTVAINTPLFYVLILIWPILLGLCSTVLAPSIVTALKVRRVELNSYLNTNTLPSSLSTRSTRLTLIALADILFTIPINIFVIVTNTQTSPIIPYPGWSATHENFNAIPRIPASEWRNPVPTETELTSGILNTMVRSMTLAGAYFDAVVYVMCSVGVFAFFGWSEEVRRGYGRVAWKVGEACGLGRKGWWRGRWGSSEKKSGKEEPTIVFATGPGQAGGVSRQDPLTFNLTNHTRSTILTHDIELATQASTSPSPPPSPYSTSTKHTKQI